MKSAWDEDNENYEDNSDDYGDENVDDNETW